MSLADRHPASPRLSQCPEGLPKAAYFDANHQVSRNLVPNAAMTTRSRWTEADKVVATNVATEKVATAPVTLTAGDLPVSPTH